MTPRMVAALANPHLDILGHCTGRIVGRRHHVVGDDDDRKGSRPESEFNAELVFAAAAHFDKAIEINSRPERLDPPMRLLALALEAGCRFSIDSDAHAPGQMEWLHYGSARAFAGGVPVERIVNAAAAGTLLDWCRSHGPSLAR
jgi:putative hydrolase